MHLFRFKEFSIRNEAAPMKINTDSVLLGVCCSILPEDRTILDIGTGTGAVALIAAQRLNKAQGGRPGRNGLLPGTGITGIDIDNAAAQEASYNFAMSPWAANIRALHASLADFQSYNPQAPQPGNITGGTYDLIVSNPPYYDNLIKSHDERKRYARHTDQLSYRDILEYAGANLSEKGRVTMILPAADRIAVLAEGSDKGLYLNRITYIHPTEDRPESRIITEFSRKRRPLESERLTVYKDGKYSIEYIKKTSELYCKF